MASIKELKATTRTGVGKGSARATRREGLTPAVIYGDKKPPLAIAIDTKTINLRVYAGHFLTTVHDIEVDGVKHRVLPRDYQLDPVKDFVVHVDFMRLGEGQKVKVMIPVHVLNHEASPGIKRGGTVNIVEHAVEMLCPADAIPDSIDVDLTGLNINASVHLKDVKLPAGAKPTASDDITLVTIVAPTGFDEAADAPAA